MEYSKSQLDFIQKKLKTVVKDMEKSKGIDTMLHFSQWAAWLSHSQLAGYSVEKATGKMFKQEGNVRTHYE